MDEDLLGLIIGLGMLLGLLALGFLAGSMSERRHYRSIYRREEELRGLMVLKLKTIPPEMTPCRTQLVTGSVVVGMDYFKMFVAALSNIIGGRIHSYETLIDRGRREAVLRLKEEARRLGAGCVMNIKFGTSNIMSGNRENKGSGCVEIIVYGTAVIPKR